MPALESRLSIPPFWREFGGTRPGKDLTSSAKRDGGGEGYNAGYAATHSSHHVEREGHSAEFLELPTGRYVVEPIEEAPVLTPEEEAGQFAILYGDRFMQPTI